MNASKLLVESTIANEHVEPTLANEPVEPIVANEPVEPIIANEPVEPIIANEPVEPTVPNQLLEETITKRLNEEPPATNTLLTEILLCLQTQANQIKQLNDTVQNLVMMNNNKKSRANTTSAQKTPVKEPKFKHVFRMKVWKTYMGKLFEAKCLCCKRTEINTFTFVIGHVIATAAGGSNKPSNLRPICSGCNTHMSDMNMNDYIKLYYND
jgi:hypothetical protein